MIKKFKGKKVNVYAKANNEGIDNYYFSEGIFDFNKKSFVAKNTEVKFTKKFLKIVNKIQEYMGFHLLVMKKTVIKKGYLQVVKLLTNVLLEY